MSGDSAAKRVPTGIAGLDEALDGGLPGAGLYLLEGEAGSGKTTLSLHFLRRAAALGEPTLLVACSETLDELGALAVSHGWSLDGIAVMDLSDLREAFGEDGQQSLFHPSDIEFTRVIEQILDRAKALRPTRMVIDSLSELRHLTGDASRYRLQIEALKPSLIAHRSTVLLCDGPMPGDSGFGLHTLVHGVIGVDYLTPEFGPYRRRLRVRKLRNTRFLEGFHDFEIRKGGIILYPRLIAAEPTGAEAGEQVTTGIDGLDRILAGGLDRGTSTLLLGAAGCGKSSLATRIALAALERGERAAIYLFDERMPVLLQRSASLGMDLRPHLESGQLIVFHIDPLELSPGKFSHLVREAVVQGVGTVIVDSLTGSVMSMGDEAGLVLQIRGLLTCLASHRVTTVLVAVQHGLLEPTEQSAAEASYLADTVILLRYYEFRGEARRAVSVFKRRAGAHVGTIEDIEFSANGLRIGSPLRQFQGVLTGVPTLQEIPSAP